MKTFFTSDLHFGHENVIEFDGRPWNTVEEMNEGLIKRWNNKVERGDIVYVLGDLIWKTMTNDAAYLIKRLNGQIILIKGNHDRFLHNAAAKKALAGVKDYDDICVALDDGSTRRCGGADISRRRGQCAARYSGYYAAVNVPRGIPPAADPPCARNCGCRRGCFEPEDMYY